MNWDIFSTTGYISIAMWLCMPLLWLVHFAILRQRGWLVHCALLVGVAAFLLAKINSHYYVNRIQVDRSKEVESQLTKQEMARQAAIEAREAEVAQITFAEDSASDFLDIAGMDEADRKYLESLNNSAEPEWKKEKKERTAGTVDNSLEAQIGATDEQQGVESAEVLEEEVIEPILMSDKDKLAANRLDSANLSSIRFMLLAGLFAVVIDYLGRANRYDRSYFPLPLPSKWVDSFTPRDPVATRTDRPRRSLMEELEVFARRGESFVYITDDSTSARNASTTYPRLPFHLLSTEALNVADYNGQMDDSFVFETLWYGRNSFVVDSTERGQRMIERFVDLLKDRRDTRARAKQAVHIVWDSHNPLPDEILDRFAILGRATGYSLLICNSGSSDRPRISPKRRLRDNR